MISRSVLRYHGGKFRLAPKLIEIFPAHRTYTEAFGGAASVLMQKPRCRAEIYNDLDGEVVNVFRVLQNKSKAARLERLLRVTPFARSEFELSYKHARSNVERARRTIIRSFMGFGSDSVSRTKAILAGLDRGIRSTMRTGFRRYANDHGITPATDWRHFSNCIDAFTDRLQGVTIENCDACKLLVSTDSADTLHYVDPPYPFAQRSGDDHRYRHEMEDEDHRALAAILKRLKGMVIVSSYPGGLYAELFRDWRSIEWTGGQFCSANSNSQKRTECVWLNDAAWSRSVRRLPFDEASA
jgi:DNA adenine methylase